MKRELRSSLIAMCNGAFYAVRSSNRFLGTVLLFLMVMMSWGMFGQTATYTVTSTSAVTTSGTAPSGSTATYSQTFGTVSQITNGNNAKLTLTGYAGYKITSIVLSMKSNAGAGAGTLSVLAGSTSIASVSPTAAFNTPSWNNAYSTSYVNVTKTPTAYTIGSGESVVITIAATTNSLYINGFTITYAPAVTTYSLTYNGNTNTGGSAPTDSNSPYAAASTVTVLGNTGSLVKTGYTFSVWNTAADGTGTDRAPAATFSMPAANTTLYAKWTPNNNTITFDKNAADATGTMASQTLATAATANLTANGFSRAGYTFQGWATTSGGAVAYNDGASYTMGTSNVTLYAKWVNLAPTATSVNISGTTTVGQTLTGNYTYNDTDPQGTSTFKWYRADDASGTGEVAIGGATATTYTLAAGDFGKYIRFSVVPVATAGTLTGIETFSPRVGAIAAGASPIATLTGTLAESSLSTDAVQIDLTNTSFVDSVLSTANFTLNNAPTGMAIDDVVYDTATSVLISFTYDNTDFDADISNFSITIAGSELTTGSPLTTNTTTITAATETLTVGAMSAGFGSQCLTQVSGQQTFTVSGTNLKSGNISLAALSGFAYSETSGGPYTNTLSFAHTGGNLASKTIYVVFTPTLVQSYNGDIIVSSTGAPSVNRSVTGSGISGTVAVTNVAANTITTTGASSGGTAISTTCGTITVKGVVWGTSASPTIPSVNSTSNGTGTSNFTSAITGLTSNTVYNYRAYASNSNGITNYGTNATFTTVSSPPTLPTAGTETTSGFTASWTAPTGQGSATLTYTVRVYSNNTFTTQVGSDITGISGTSTVITTLSPNTTYYYQVIAVNAGGSSTTANFSSGVTTLSLPNLVISEFAGAGYGNDFNNEYIEISNLGASTINLSGWTLEYYNNNSSSQAAALEATLSLTGSIAPNTAYVIAARTTYNSITPNFVPSSSFSMNSTGFAILKMGSTVIDQAATFAGKFADNKNYEFTNCPSDNSIVANWDDLGTGNGTPGVVNCACTAQSITAITASLTKTTTDVPYSVATTASSGLTVSYGSSNTGVATVDASGTVTIVGVGTTTITVSQAGNSTYCAATSVTQTLTVVATPVVTGASLSGNVGSSFTHTIVATNSPTSYNVTGSLPPGLTRTGNVISGTPTTAGIYSVTITATNIAGTSDPATFDFNIAKGNQTITFAAINKTYGDANFNLTATTPSGLTITYVSSDPTVASISGSTVTILKAGTTNITASQSGDSNWNAAADNIKLLTVAKKPLTVTGLSVATKIYDGTDTATINGTGVLGGGIISPDDVTLLPPTDALFSDKNAATNKSVSATYTLAGAQKDNYTVTPPTLTGTIDKKTLTVTGAVAQNKPYDGNTNATITGGTLNGIVGTEVVTLTGGGTFTPDANIGTGKSVTATLSLSGVAGVIANYSLTQPTGLTANITAIAPTFTTSDINLSVGGTYTLPGANISSNSAGTLSYLITPGGTSTLSGTTLTGASVGTETLTVNQAANGNYLAGSTTVTVNTLLITHVTGDYRTNPAFTGAISFNTATATAGIFPWQSWSGSAWVDTTSSPQSLTTKPENIYIISGSTVNVATGGTYNNIIVESATTIVSSSNTTTGLTIAGSKTLDIKAGTFDLSGYFELLAGSNLIVRTNAVLDISSTSFSFARATSSNFTVENQGTVHIRKYLADVWRGNEDFAGESVFNIYAWDRTVELLTAATVVTTNSVGSKFGYLTIDLGTSSINGNWTYMLPVETFTLTHKNFTITSNNTNNISLNADNVTIGGDFIVAVTSSGAVQVQTQAGSKTVNVKGNFVKNGSGNFRATNSGSGYVTTINVDGNFSVNAGTFYLDSGATIASTSIVNLKGNLYKALGAYMLNSNTNNTINAFNFIGNTTQTVDLSVNTSSDMLNYRFFIKNGAYVQTINQDWKLANNSKITVENGGTMDFGFTGSTPLNVLETTSSATTTFDAQPGSTLKITSTAGIVASGSSGNVQLDTRTFATTGVYGDYHYIGKANQSTGNALPVNARNLTINNEGATNDVTLTQALTVHTTLTMTQGNIVSTPTLLLELGSGTSTKGTLAYTSGYVKGSMKRWFAGTNSGNATGLFPFGTTGNLNRFAKVEYTGAPTTGGSLTGSTVNTAMGNSGLATLSQIPLTGSCPAFSVLSTDDSFWTLTPTSLAGGTYDATLQKESASTTPICKLTVLKRDVTDWLNPGTHIEPTGTTTNIIVKRTGLTGIKDLGIGNGNCSTTPIVYSSTTLTPVPTRFDSIEIQNNIEIGTGVSIVACECKVDNNASMTVKSGGTLTLMNGLTVENDGDFVIEDSGSLVQVNDVDNATANNNSGNILMHRNAKPMFRYDFTYWSSPVAGTTLHDLSPITLFDKYFKWNHSASTQAWQAIPNGTESMVAGRGYIVRAPQNYAVETPTAAPGNFIGDFIGKPNNGTVTHAVTGGTDKWNLIGNPYPSAISADLFFNANVGPTSGNNILEGTLYLWTHNTGIVPTSTGSQLYVYNSGDYASYNGTGGTATVPGDGTVNMDPPSGNIAAGQSFFIKGTADGEVIFNNSMRIAGNNGQFFRPAPTEPLNNWDMTGKHRVWLNMKGETKGFSQILVGYIENASNDWDTRFDGENFGGNQVTLYSVLDTKKLVIQGRALPFNNQDEVPLGYKSTLNGTLTINLDHYDGLFEGQDVYLEDKLLNIVHDLKESAYSFTSTIGTFNERFVLRYLPSEELSNPGHEAIANGLIVYQENNTIMLKSQLEDLSAVTVYDLLGRIVFDQNTIGKREFGIQNVVMNEQPLIIKVKLANGQVVNKKIVY